MNCSACSAAVSEAVPACDTWNFIFPRASYGRPATPITVCIVSDVRVHCDAAGRVAVTKHWPLIKVLGAHTAGEAPSAIRR